MFEAPKNPQSINTELPSNIVSTIVRMVEKPTQKRYTTWESINDALKVQALLSETRDIILKLNTRIQRQEKPIPVGLANVLFRSMRKKRTKKRKVRPKSKRGTGTLKIKAL